MDFGAAPAPVAAAPVLPGPVSEEDAPAAMFGGGLGLTLDMANFTDDAYVADGGDGGGGGGGGPMLDMGAFGVDGGTPADPMNETFKMSATGCVDIEGIRVGGAGIQKSVSTSSSVGPEGPEVSAYQDGLRALASLMCCCAVQKSENFRDTSVRIEVLGQGASGTVYKMVHVPTLTIVAAKARQSTVLGLGFERMLL